MGRFPRWMRWVVSVLTTLMLGAAWLGVRIAVIAYREVTCGRVIEAAAHGDVGTVEASGAGAQCLTNSNDTPIHGAARAGQSSTVLWLLEHGSSIEAPGVAGRRPLYEAAKYGHVELVDELLRRGADVDGRSEEGFTPLIAAAERHQSAVVERLLRAGADVNAVNMFGMTPLLQYASRGKLEDAATLQALLEHGAALDVHDDRERTPLHHAASAGRHELVRALLDAGAFPNSFAHRQMPINVAGGYPEVVELLTSRSVWGHSLEEGVAPPVPIVRTGVVVRRSGSGPRVGERCEMNLRANRGGHLPCFLTVECAGEHVYGERGGFLQCGRGPAGPRASDIYSRAADGDPTVIVDPALGVLFLDDGVPGGTALQIRLDGLAPPPR